MKLTIRQAARCDEAALAKLNGMIQALHVQARPDVFVPVSPAGLAEWFLAVLRNEDQRVWLAEIDGVPAGYLLAVIHDRPATPFSVPRRWCEIDQLGVAEGMRERGVARALVNAAIGWAREHGVTRVSAQCWSFNCRRSESVRATWLRANDSAA